MTFRPRKLEALGNRIAVSIAKDEQGYLGRECPQKECDGYFKIKPGTGLTGSDLPCHCPYCGHTEGQDKFYTPDQIEYVKSVALGKVTEAIREDLKTMEFNQPVRGPFGVGISLTFKPGRAIPIHHYREKSLETEIVCEACTLAYTIYGLFGFCPDCGDHNSFQILSKNLDLVLKQLELVTKVDDEGLKRHLTEDALENCVSAFDGFGRESCRVRAHLSKDATKAQAISFQNPNGFAKRVVDVFGVDVRSTMAPADWDAIHRGFMKRHVVAHRSGITDSQYVSDTGDASAVVGRRIPLDERDIRELARLLRSLGQALIGILPRP
jgi:hypothetical protein